MDAKNSFGNFDPSLPMSAYEDYDMTGTSFGESAPGGEMREFILGWDDFEFDRGMKILDAGHLPPMPLLGQDQPAFVASFLGNDSAVPSYNTGSQFPFPNQGDADLTPIAISSSTLSGVQGESGIDGSTKTTQLRDSEQIKLDGTSEPTPKKRKPRKKKNPPSEKEQREKKERLLERNRKAAQKCREKKKGWVEDVKEKCMRLQRDHDSLKFQIAETSHHLAMTKQLLAQHAGCGIPDIDHLLQNMSRNEPSPMDRTLSSQSYSSHESTSSVQKDSGISNMGTPPDERQNPKQLQEDEGFGGTVHFGPGEQYKTQAKIPISDNPLVGLLADLQDPAEFLGSIGIDRAT